MRQSDFEKLQQAYVLRGAELERLQAHVSELEQEIARLNELLKLKQHNLFGKKSEGGTGLNSPFSPKIPPAQATDPSTLKTVTVASHTRTIPPRGKRRFNTPDLPRYTLIHDLPEAEKICACCQGSLHVIDQEKSEQLEIIPVQYCVIEHIQLKYGCRTCVSVVMAPKPMAPLPKAIAGASLLTDVILNKYQYHLPLYRQSKIMRSSEVDVPDKTLANWVFAAGEALLKVYEAMWVVLKQRYLQVDETPVKVLETNKKGYVWTYFAPNVGQQGLVVFEFSLTRQAEVVNQRLKTFRGLLQTDGYGGYEGLRKREGIVGFGCLTHARRKFVECVKVSGDSHGIAAEMIERLKPLYALEARMRETQGGTLHHRSRQRLRQKIARPILTEIHSWLCAVRNNVLPKSKLGQAIDYTLKQWRYLTAYLRHGMAEIDTNYVENKIREIALGKKNWLFIGNSDCGKIHALWYTLIISAVINDLNPRVYIHYLLTKVHELRKEEIDPITLLPDRIDTQKLEAFAKEQIEFGRKMLHELKFS